MNTVTKPTIPLSIPGRIIMPYRYAVGATGSRFFVELRDNKRIMGIKCPSCKRVYVPPRSTCMHCFEKLNEWVDLPAKGVLQTFTSVHYSLSVHPVPAPLMYGIVILDGASTGLTHFISEAETEELKIGMRMEAVFSEERRGTILDIAYFKPA